MANTVNDSAIKKLKLLFTVVDKPKGEFYMDVISQFEVNCQMSVGGRGTARSEIVDLLGLNPQKTVISAWSGKIWWNPFFRRWRTSSAPSRMARALPLRYRCPASSA